VIVEEYSIIWKWFFTFCTLWTIC